MPMAQCAQNSRTFVQTAPSGTSEFFLRTRMAIKSFLKSIFKLKCLWKYSTHKKYQQPARLLSANSSSMHSRAVCFACWGGGTQCPKAAPPLWSVLVRPHHAALRKINRIRKHLNQDVLKTWGYPTSLTLLSPLCTVASTLTHLKGLCNQLMSFSHFTAEETDAWENELLIVTHQI